MTQFGLAPSPPFAGGCPAAGTRRELKSDAGPSLPEGPSPDPGSDRPAPVPVEDDDSDPDSAEDETEHAAASTMQGVLRGYAVRHLMHMGPIVTKEEDSPHGEYLLEHVWLTPRLGRLTPTPTLTLTLMLTLYPRLGLRCVGRGDSRSANRGVIVSEVPLNL